MKITPLEIRQKTFEKAFRGFNPDEVQAFLNSLSYEWERLSEENKDLKARLETSAKEVQKMKEVESSLYKTLKTAEETSNNMMDQASKEAELMIREANLKSDALLEDAKRQARTMIDDAYKQSEKLISDMRSEVKGMEQNYNIAENNLENLVRELRNLATDILEKVEKTAAKSKATAKEILVNAANIKPVKVELEEELAQVGTVKSFNNEKSVREEITKMHVEKEIVADKMQPTSENNVSVKPAVAEVKEEPMTQKNPEIPGPEKFPPDWTQPETPKPFEPRPEIERPRREDIPHVPAPEIEQPKPEIERETPKTPEPQPASVKEQTVEKPKKLSTSFFDDLV